MINISGQSSWRSGNDIGQLYDNVTPNPTGSLSGPYFVEGPQNTVIGIKGKTSNIACSIKNLGNMTVSKDKMFCHSSKIFSQQLSNNNFIVKIWQKHFKSNL